MKQNPILAAFWFYEIYKSDKEFAGKIISNFQSGELKKLNKMIAKINPFSRDLKNKFTREISKIFLNKTQYAKAKLKEKPVDIFNIFFIIFSLIICLILVWMKISSFFENNSGQPNQDLWLTSIGLLTLFPFFLALALKGKYFSKNQTVFQNLFSIFSSSLLLIGLLSILNYLSRSEDVVGQRQGITLIMIIFFAILIGPWIEEVLFRGLLFDQIASLFNKNNSNKNFTSTLNARDTLSLNSIIFAFFLSSAAFAFIHRWESPMGFLIYFLCGIILSWQRYQSGKLWNSWISHAFANSVIVFS